jgi:hypothetical protein
MAIAHLRLVRSLRWSWSKFKDDLLRLLEPEWRELTHNPPAALQNISGFQRVTLPFNLERTFVGRRKP